jgi:potassium-transporting ATPase KdpC subunit
MLKQLKPAIISVLVFTVLCGLVFPFVITGTSQVIFPRQANGSLIQRDGKVIGSELIGQMFTRPEYFHPRPSAAGTGYDAANSGASNLGPTSNKLINGIHKKLADGAADPGNFDGIRDLATAYRQENALPAGAPIPADAVTRSASGLDPHISPRNAAMQVPRVARARGIPEEIVGNLVQQATQGRTFGFLGEPRVNVLLLNIALDSLLVVGRR